jgi:hypothetical protein
VTLAAAVSAALSFFFVRVTRNTIQPMMAMTRRPRGTPTPVPTATGRLELPVEKVVVVVEEEEVNAGGRDPDVVLMDATPVSVLVSPVLVILVDPDVVVLMPITVTIVAAAIGGYLGR